MQKPTIELKNIQIAAFASEETNCYTATLYVDGEKWGTVGNDGHGGPDHFHGAGKRSYSDIRDLNERIKATFPPEEFEGTTLHRDLDWVCSELVTQHLIAKDLKRALNAKLLFTKPGAEGIYQVPLKQKGRTFTVEAVEKAMRAKHPNMTVLNTMPFAEALTLYAANA